MPLGFSGQRNAKNLSVLLAPWGDMDRRTFLLGTASIAATVVAAPTFAAPRQTLWGDGVHDDAPALNALMRGEVVMTPAGDAIADAKISGGTYRMGSTLVLGDGADISNAEFMFEDGVPVFLDCTGGFRDVHVANSTFKPAGPRVLPWHRVISWG